jgi:hypothetical protein
MRHFIILLSAVAAFNLNLKAQEIRTDQKSVSITQDTAAYKDTVKLSGKQDTTIVRIGKNDVKVITHGNNTEILLGKNKIKKHHAEKFEGHWQGLDMGFNGFDNADYSMYEDKEFMSVNQGKSYEVGLNLWSLNIGIYKSYVGLVSGIGFTFNDYKFENRYTIAKSVDRINPVPLNYVDLEKTKLSVGYLNVPLLLEFQIPVNQNEGRVYINAGILGGVKLGSHTKVKHGGTKDKDYSGFNINSFKYDATARIGYKDIGLYAKYSMNSLFQTGKGPELTPFTIGISFGI